MTPAPLDTLTIREKHILLMVSEGKTNRQIAASLNFAPGTVRNHVSVILDKLGCENRAALAAYAVTNHLAASRFWELAPQIQAEVIDYGLELLEDTP